MFPLGTCLSYDHRDPQTSRAIETEHHIQVNHLGWTTLPLHLSPALPHQLNMTFPIAKPAPVSETYTMDGDESTRTAELVFAYLATTIGPRSHRASHLWTPHYRAILSGVLRRAYLHPSLAGAACIFIGRLKQRRPLLELSGKAGLKLFIAALVVADKCIHDCSLARKAWVGVLDGVLTLQELSQLELELLVGIEWQTLLRKQLCYDMQELGKGWWAMKHNGCSPDFFTGQRWDGRRPWAFEFFDGLSKDIKYRYMWTPCYPSTTKSPSNTELPGVSRQLLSTLSNTHCASQVFHHASHSIWDTIKPGVDPPVKRKPPLPSSPLCSGSTSGSDSSGSPSDSDEDCSSKSSCDSTPPNAECLPCPLYSGKVVARTTPDALQMVEVELIEDVSRENLSRGQRNIQCSPEHCCSLPQTIFRACSVDSLCRTDRLRIFPDSA